MIEQFKADRVAQLILLCVILLGCFTCGIFGVFIFNLSTRNAAPINPPVRNLSPATNVPTLTDTPILSTETPVPTNTSIPSTETPVPTNTPQPTATDISVPISTATQSLISPTCDCSGNFLNCDDFDDPYDAQFCYESCPGDPHELDRDKDGYACEWKPE